MLGEAAVVSQAAPELGAGSAEDSTMLRKHLILASLTAIALASSAGLYAAGGKNAYNNPSGDPSSDTFETPFANYDGDGRMMVFCAEDELLVVVPAEGGALEVTCQTVE
jgi:hypothetical protein